MNKVLFWIGLGLLIALNFAIQNFDFTHWNNHPKPLYQYQAGEISWQAFILNKSIRLLLNLCSFFLLQQRFYPNYKKSFGLLSALISLLAMAALYSNFEPHHIGINAGQNLYNMLHKIAFSPLITIIIIATLFATPSTKNKLS
jgi:hypothetical protein